jgi:methionyl-tRNA formyltransferase
MTDKLKIVFAGTPEIARMVLENILKHNFNVELVLTQPDRPAGRGLKLTPSPVKELALQHDIEVFQPLSFRKDPDAIEKIRALQPDIMVVVAYGLILPQALLDIPRLGCINIHVSLLPKWRGAAPIQRAVLAGDKVSGVTIMQMDAGLDTGDMLIVESVTLDADETSGSLHDKLASVGAHKIVEFLTNPEQYIRQPQSLDGTSYAPKIDKEEARIDWSESATAIERKIRGYNPFPGAFTYLENKLHKIWQAQIISGRTTSAPFGSIITAAKDELWVACGDGNILALQELQEAGAKRKLTSQYLQGKNGLVGQRFGSE